MNRREFVAAGLAFPIAPSALLDSLRRSDPEPVRLGASTACLAGYSLLDALSELRRMDFSTVEVIAYTGASHSGGEIPGFDMYESTERERERVYEATRPFRHISAHMPFHELRPLSSDAQVREASLERIRQAIDGLAYLEGELAVVHPGWPDEGRSFRDIWPQMLDTFRSLGDYAGERGIRIGLETMQPNSVRDYTDLMFDIDHPMVGATIDTGHIRGSTDIGLPPERRDSAEARNRFNDVLGTLFTLLGDKVLHVHLSDVQRADWRDHRAIGSGIIDFARVFRTLDATDYDGLLVFELEEPNQLEALQASKALAEELMRNPRS